MSGVDFADRYAEAHLKPSAEVVAARQASAARIQEIADKNQLLGLVAVYYAMKPDLSWFRDEFRKEDTTFSLVTSERESVVLAALILAAKIEEGDPTSILGVLAGSVQGKRTPTEAGWLLTDARSALVEDAATARVPRKVTTSVRHSATPKLAEEITAAVESLDDMAQVLAKVRHESQESAGYLARQVTDALLALNANARYQREESQILWWLFGEHSRTLEKPFSAFGPAQAALISGIELAALTEASELGPVASEAVLERVLRCAKRDNKAQSVTLLGAVDGLGTDLAKLRTPPPVQPGICPVLTAMAKSMEIGSGAWGNAFNKATGLDAAVEFEPIDLALQVYRECLLGKTE